VGEKTSVFMKVDRAKRRGGDLWVAQRWGWYGRYGHLELVVKGKVAGGTTEEKAREQDGGRL